MNDKFACVIDGVIRTASVRRGAVFNHPVTRKPVRLGATTADEYFEKYDLYPLVDATPDSYDPLRQTRGQAPAVWDPVAKTVTPRWTITDKTVEQAATRKRSEIAGRLDSGLSSLASGSTSMRRETWPLMAEQARLFKRKNTAVVRALRKRALRAGVTVDAMADRIIAKADVYEDAIAELTGQEDVLSDAVAAAESHPTWTDAEKIDAIVAVVWPA